MEVKLLIKYHHTRVCNCYGILSDNAAIVIDPGKFTDEVYIFLAENSDKERIIFLTHPHFDHILGAEELREKTGTKIACDERSFSREYGHIIMPPIEFYGNKPMNMEIDTVFHADCDIKVGDLTVKVIHTPGHHIGEASFLIGDNLFSGDTLFYETIGVTKYPTGSKEDMLNSISKLKKLDRNVKVFPGHGKFSDIGHELDFNPFMREKNVDLQSLR